MDRVYTVAFFEDELSLIENEEIRKLTRQALEEAPAYIWSIASSVTGKYHPPGDNLPGGLCRHLKKTAWMGYRLFHNLDEDTDVGVSAGLLHDICQRGIDSEPSDDIEQYKKHGFLAAQRLEWQFRPREERIRHDLFDQKETQSEMDILGRWANIADCIRTHMGRWGLDPPESQIQLLFHCADVAASTRGFEGIPFLVLYDAPVVMTIEEIVGKPQLFLKDEEGELVFNFGKHSGKRLAEVAKDNPGYLRWMGRQGVQTKENPDGFPAEIVELVKAAYIEAKSKYTEQVAHAWGIS